MTTVTPSETIKKAAKISVAEPVSALRYIKIRECGEDLVDFLVACPELLHAKQRFHYRRETLIRRSLAEKLCAASKRLPTGRRLAIVEGWRAPHIQARMYRFVWDRIKEQHPDWSDVTLTRFVNKFSAPMNVRVPPPHTTGAAVDLMLTDEAGNELDHSSPYEPFDPKGNAFDAPELSPTARETRAILAEALIPAGITNYPSEYWHWSYGDQGWAYRGGHPNAIYAAITPPDWTPAPEDEIDSPLAFIEEVPVEAAD